MLLFAQAVRVAVIVQFREAPRRTQHGIVGNLGGNRLCDLRRACPRAGDSLVVPRPKCDVAACFRRKALPEEDAVPSLLLLSVGSRDDTQNSTAGARPDSSRVSRSLTVTQAAVDGHNSCHDVPRSPGRSIAPFRNRAIGRQRTLTSRPHTPRHGAHHETRTAAGHRHIRSPLRIGAGAVDFAVLWVVPTSTPLSVTFCHAVSARHSWQRPLLVEDSSHTLVSFFL